MQIQQSLSPCLPKGPADSQSERGWGGVIRTVKANLQSKQTEADASSQTSQFPQDQETKSVGQFLACFTASDAIKFILVAPKLDTSRVLVMKDLLYI